jgi:hypothetical protein
MKKIAFLIGMMLFALALFAQGGKGDGPLSEERWKEFEAQKVAFFTREMNLTPDEATKFWPLYNEMQTKIRKAAGPTWRPAGKDASLTEQQAHDRVKALLDAEETVLKLRREYYRKIASEISARKLWLMLDAERDFHRQLVKRLGRNPGDGRR